MDLKNDCRKIGKRADKNWKLLEVKATDYENQTVYFNMIEI